MIIEDKKNAARNRFPLTNSNTVEIGTLNYWEGNKVSKGTLYCRHVLGIMLLILQTDSGDGEIASLGEFNFNGKTFNARIEGEKDKYFNVPQPVVKACEHADLFVTISSTASY